MKWGLVPHWSKHEDKTLSTTNARSENLIEGGGMWGSLRGTKRCAIPCQGYYEWLTKGKQKLPHFTKPKDRDIMLLAGLYDSAVIEGRTLWTFTIVTTDANKDFSWLHDRQPVILSSDRAVAEWLDTSSKTWSKQLSNLVQPYHDPNVALECYQVPQEVGKVGTESPTFIEPIAARKDGIQAMFSKQKQSQIKAKVEGETTIVSKKRTRSPSPVTSAKEDGLPAKKVKQEDLKPSSSQDRAGSPRKLSPKKPVQSQKPDTKPITSFFAKKS